MKYMVDKTNSSRDMILSTDKSVLSLSLVSSSSCDLMAVTASSTGMLVNNDLTSYESIFSLMERLVN